jgi:aspartate--ammonia ligase
MGIRVDPEAMLRQLKIAGCEHWKEYAFHRELLEGKLPQTIGGGIGQSRLCMYFLEKAHIGEVQAAVWPKQIIEMCRENNIFLL